MERNISGRRRKQRSGIHNDQTEVVSVQEEVETQIDLDQGNEKGQGGSHERREDTQRRSEIPQTENEVEPHDQQGVQSTYSEVAKRSVLDRKVLTEHKTPWKPSTQDTNTNIKSVRKELELEYKRSGTATRTFEWSLDLEEAHRNSKIFLEARKQRTSSASCCKACVPSNAPDLT